VGGDGGEEVGVVGRPGRVETKNTKII